MKQWYMHISDMLRHVNDVLNPHGFEEILKDDFAALRQMLHRTGSVSDADILHIIFLAAVILAVITLIVDTPSGWTTSGAAEWMWHSFCASNP
jgi:hypothetical protein